MPSKERYARQKAAAAAKGTTPYEERVQAARRRYGPATPLASARGHAERRTESLEHRRRARALRAGFGVAPTPWCAVCGASIADTPGVSGASGPRPNSYTCRICTLEQVTRFRQEGDAWASFRGLARLARDEVWVRRRQEQSRRAGIAYQRFPDGIEVA